MRYFVKEKEKIAKEIAKTKTEIRRIVSLVFPELGKKPPPFFYQVLNIFYEFCSADRIRKVFFKEFIKRRSFESREKRGAIEKEKIYRLTKDSIAGSYSLYEKLLKIKMRRFKYLVEERKEIKGMIEKKTDRLFKREIGILTSVPEIAKKSAIYFMAEIVDIKRFKNKRKLIEFCGLNPVIKQSGS